MAPTRRPEPRSNRVSEEVREVLAEEIPRLKDPRVGFVTVTGTHMSSDLRHAWVSYTTLGRDRERAATRAGLRSATAHLRAVIGREIRLKFLPELHFEEDDTVEQTQHIEELLHKLHEADRDG
jgi:ribosome-binding factor A